MQTTRVQAQRKNGQIVVPFDLYCGRACHRGGWKLPASIWANPYHCATYGREQCLDMYCNYIINNQYLLSSLPQLKGLRLACFCPLTERCHVDILIQLVNNL